MGEENGFIPIQQTGYNRTLKCSDEVFDRIMTDGVTEILRLYPQFTGVKMTQNLVLDIMSKYFQDLDAFGVPIDKK